MWVSLLMALISFLTAKKSGKSSTQAAAIGAAAGLGTYYVTTETDWGKTTLGALNNSIADVVGGGYVNDKGAKVDPSTVKPVLDPAGNQIYDDRGRPIYQTDSKPVQLDGNGVPVRQPDGSIANALITGTAGVLKSWGPTGTAAVIGTASVAGSSGGVSGFVKDNALLILLGFGALLILRGKE